MSNIAFPVPIHLQLAPAYQASSGDTPVGLFEEDVPRGLKEAVLRRDCHVCQCCGFYARKYQCALPMEGRTRDLNDLITTCHFCYQCFRLDQVSAMRSGVLVYLPEITQADLHHVARDIYRARVTQGTFANSARRWLDLVIKKDRLGNRRAEAVKRVGTDDPFHLAPKLRDTCSADARAALKQALEGIRLFPLDRRILKEADLEFNQFPQILAYWRSKSGPFTMSQEYPWLLYAIEALGGTPPASETPPSSAFAAVQADPGEPHVSIGLRHLQEAAETIEAMVPTYPELAETLQDRIQIIVKLAEACVVDPEKAPNESLGARLNAGRQLGKQSAKRWLGVFLGDIARYFDALITSNVTVPRSMPLNTERYKLLSRLLMSETTA